MSTFKTDSEYHVWFESLEEMEREMPAMIDQHNADLWRTEVMGVRRGYSWFGCADAATAMRYIKDGWPELSESLQPKIDKLRKSFNLDNAAALNVEVRRRKRQRGDHGDTLDMTKVWNGDMEHAWERPVKFPRISNTQKYATIFADCAVNCSVTSEETLWRAAAIHCMIEMLTRMGVNTEIWSGASAHGIFDHGPRFLWAGVRVKDFTQPLNYDRLATMLCSVFFRTWLFGAYMAAPWRANKHLGFPRGHGLVKPLRDRQEAGERVFRIGNCLNEWTAEAEIKRVVAEIQKPKEEEAA